MRTSPDVWDMATYLLYNGETQVQILGWEDAGKCNLQILCRKSHGRRILIDHSHGVSKIGYD